MKANEFINGYYDCLDGRSIKDNPHKYNTKKYISWEAGWIEAADEIQCGL